MVLIVVSNQIIQEELAREILRIYHDFAKKVFKKTAIGKHIIPEELAREILRIYHNFTLIIVVIGQFCKATGS